MAGSGDRKREREDHYRRAAMFHLQRQRIARLLADGAQLAAIELAAKLEQPLSRTVHHLRVLVRWRVLKVVPKCRPNPPLYRWSDDADWAREMLVVEDE